MKSRALLSLFSSSPSCKIRNGTGGSRERRGAQRRGRRAWATARAHTRPPPRPHPRAHTHSHTHSLTRARRPPARRSLGLRTERGQSRHRGSGRGRQRRRRRRRRSRLQAPLETLPQLQRRTPLEEPGPWPESELESGPQPEREPESGPPAPPPLSRREPSLGSGLRRAR